MSSEEYTSEEENPTLEPPIPQQVIEENLERHPEHTEEEGLIADLSQHFDKSLHLEDQPQSSPFNHHKPLPPLAQMSNQPTAAVATVTTPWVSELCLGWPDDFDGSSNKASAWIDSVMLYLMINDTLYNQDQKKIAFALSIMKEGSAATWASTFTKKALALTPPTLGTWTSFYSDFKTSFIHIDVKNEAIAWLTTTCVSKNLPLGDYISQFKNHITLSKINKDALINFFSRGIPISLMKQIYAMDTVPTKINDWYTCAVHFKTQWDRADAIDLITPTLSRKTTPLITKVQTPKSIHMPWTSTPSALKNSLKKKGKNASRKVVAFNAENPDTPLEIAPCSPITTLILMENLFKREPSLNQRK